ESQVHGDPGNPNAPRGTAQYVYSEMAGGANHSRLKQLIYPNGRILRNEYTAGAGYAGLDDRLSRLSFLADDNGGAVGTRLEEYSYLGLGTVVKRTHPQGVYTIGLTYLKQPGDLPLDASIDPGDQYTGLDRFGRVRDQRWLKTNAVITTLDDFVYGYDPDG